MKKLLRTLTAACLLSCSLVGFAACNDDSDVLSVYAPDGAPALALVNAIEGNSEDFEYHVVDSSTISGYVTGEDPEADYCILPLNAASKLLGTGETYQMLGTVTNGNLYFLSTGDNATLTSENLTTLVGKTVGVVQLTNVPGLTLRVVLDQYDIDYQIIESLEAETASDKVNLLAMEATNVTPAGGCDYYLCPEPAATTKISGTASAATSFFLAGDLQELYGENGYPQAVLVAKTTVIDSENTEKLVSYLEAANEYLQTVDNDTVLSALDGVRTEGLTPSFSATNLNATVIANCSVKFTSAQNAKTDVNAFLEKLIAVSSSAASAVSDAFFYEG